jgi:hypothetical protein
MKPSIPLCVLFLGLAACTQTGGDVAADAVSAADPTGIAGGAISQVRAFRDESDEPDTAGFDLASVGVPLQEVAQGNTSRRNLMAGVKSRLTDMRNAMVARQAMSIASTVAGAAMSGGVGLAAAAPSLVMQAASTGVAMGAMHSAEGQIDQAMQQAEAQRAAERIVPEEDRPAEAQAILSIVNGSGGRSAAWQNPQTGASGRVSIRRTTAIPGGIRCRIVEREWKRSGERRKGGMTVCNQNGVWFDLS